MGRGDEPNTAAGNGAKTMAAALETAAHTAGSKPLEPSDARAIQSAEARASGIPTGVKGGLSAAAHSAVDTNTPATVGDILNRPMPVGGDKVVTTEDAAYVQSAEQRNDPSQTLTRGGVAASVDLL